MRSAFPQRIGLNGRSGVRRPSPDILMIPAPAGRVKGVEENNFHFLQKMLDILRKTDRLIVWILGTFWLLLQKTGNFFRPTRVLPASVTSME
jgi:hypothetical protein